MREHLREIDRLLRGQLTKPEDLSAGGWSIRAGRLTTTAFVLGASYGACMGLFALLRGGIDGVPQVLASTIKVPLLFLLTLLVTFPSLYVFAALFRTSLRFADTLRLLLAAIAVNLALLASLGPVVAFFTLSTTSYPFMLILNVLVFTLCGLVGVGFLRQSLRRLAQWQPTAVPVGEAAGEHAPATLALVLASLAPVVAVAYLSTRYYPAATLSNGACFLLATVGGHVATARAYRPLIAARPRHRLGLALWVVLYVFVSIQLAWVLRPFVGDPNSPTAFWRDDAWSNAYVVLADLVAAVFAR